MSTLNTQGTAYMNTTAASDTREQAEGNDEIGFARTMRHIRSTRPLTKDEETQLFKDIRDGTPEQAARARARLVDGVSQWVVKVARSYEGRGVELQDLIQEGMDGVVYAIGKFDPARGFRFMTYADDWIRQRMSRACTNLGSVDRHGYRLPDHMYMAVGRVQKEAPKLQDLLGREPTVDELAEATKLKPATVETAQDLISRSLVSMDDNWGGDEDSGAAVHETIADDQACRPLDDIVTEEVRDAVWSVYQQLSEEEQQVLAMRNAVEVPGLKLPDGVIAGQKYTEAQACAALGLGKSRLVTIQRRARAKLRASDVLGDLATEVLENEGRSNFDDTPSTAGV
jgi:RNA polymerase primary sigma factor